MKKILLLILLIVPMFIYAQQQIINIGTAANSGTGDPLRTAFTKCNTNFTQLFELMPSAAKQSSWDAKVSFPGFGTTGSTAAFGNHNHSGVYQPLGSYLTSESDPIFFGSSAYGITGTNITNWNAAYGWGNHASAGYLLSSGTAANSSLFQNKDTNNFFTQYNNNQLRNIVKDPTGFASPTDVVVTYNSANRTVTLTGATTAYFKGTLVSELISGWTSEAHTATTGVWYLYYNGTAFVWSQTPWAFDFIQIASVHYNTDKFALREPHGVMNWQTHQELHNVIGTYLGGGGNMSNYVLSSTTAANRRPYVSATSLYDEDLLTVNAALNTNSYTVMYLEGSSSTNTYLTEQADIVPLSTNRPYYNQFTGGAWQQTLMAANNYMNVWLIAIPVTSDTESQKYRYIWVQGQNIGTLSTIQALTPSSINLGDLTSTATELLYIGRVIIRYSGSNWELMQVDKLNGNRYNQTSNPQGNYLTGVTTDLTLTGGGTAISPLKVDTSKIATAYGLSQKQATLVSGTNIKTINNTSLLGSGNISISGTAMTGSQITDSISRHISMPVSLKIPFTKIYTEVTPYQLSDNLVIGVDTVGAISGANTIYAIKGLNGKTITHSQPWSPMDTNRTDRVVKTVSNKLYTFLGGCFNSGIYRRYKFNFIDSFIIPGNDPLLLSAYTSLNGDTVSVIFNKAMQASPSSVGLSFSPAKTILSITRHATNTSRYNILVTPSFVSGDAITISYTPGTITANDGSVLGAFSGQGITNNVPILTAFSVTTNSGSSDTFNPSITTASGVASWNMGDGTTINSNSPSKSYADGSTKTVNVSLGTVPDNVSIYTISGFNSKKLLSANFSNLTGLRGSIQLHGNTSLASVTFPVTSQTITELYLNGLSLSNVVDISGLQTITGPMYLMNNSGVTNYILPTNNTGEVTYLDPTGCNITGTWNMSGIKRFSGVFSLAGLSNCDSVTFTSSDNLSTNSFTTFNVSGTKIRHLDLSKITNLSGTCTLGNVLLTSAVFPTSNKVVDIDLGNAKLTTLNVSGLTGLRKLSFDNMSPLNSLTLPATSQVTTWIKVAGSALTSLDLSSFSNLAGDIYIWNNGSMTSVTLGSSTQQINTLYFQNLASGFTTVNASAQTGLGGGFYIIGCSGVNSVTFPSTSRSFSTIQINGTSLASLNFTPIIGAVTTLNCSGNTSLASISGYNWISTAISTVNFQSCALNQATVDAILAALNTYYSSNTPTINLTLTLNGGTNAAPTNGNSNADAVNLASIFSGAGKTLTYSHN